MSGETYSAALTQQQSRSFVKWVVCIVVTYVTVMVISRSVQV